jgi:type I restriction enzyme S subunit
MIVLENDTAKSLFNLFKKTKKEFIVSKKIMDKKDKHSYPIKETAFDIPKDWAWCYLSDLSIIQEGPGIRKHQYENEGVQFLTVTNILEGSVDLNKSQKYISNSEYNNKYKHFTIDKGDIVTACSGGSWGKSSFYNLDDKIILNTSTLRLRFFNDLSENKYLYYLTKTSYFKGNLSSHSTGQQANYGYSHYSKIPIPLPPLIQQKQLVVILDKAFAAINTAKANAEQNLQNAKELFESYLQNVFSTKGDDWEEKTIGDIGKPSMCKRILKEQTTTDGDIPFYKIGTFGKAPNAYISKELYEEYKSKYSFPKKGDILISASGTIGRRVIYDGEPGFFQDSNIVWIDNDEKQVLNDYLYSFYGFCDWQPSKGATISRLYNANLKRIKITFPKSLQEQKIVIQKIEALSNKTKKLEAIYTQKIADLEEMKKSVLQKAFSGQLNTIN